MEVPDLYPSRRRNHWNWFGKPEVPRCRLLKAACQVILGVNGLAESEDRWRLEEESVKT